MGEHSSDLGGFPTATAVDHGSSPAVRFDDVRAKTTTTLEDFRGEIRASSLSEVAEALRGVESAARAGQFVGGYVGYECAPAFDRALGRSEQDDRGRVGAPLAWFGVFGRAVTTPWHPPRASGPGGSWRCHVTQSLYERRVAVALEAIRAGELYQVNLTTQLHHDGPVDVGKLYSQLLFAQTPSYGALVVLDGVAVVSASPDLFFDWDGGLLRSRPMKGTARRGRWREEDDLLARALATSAKERAENIMIVDLIRNDMGKVAEVGSVTVSELCEVERYPNVLQLVSQVECRTRPDVALVDLFVAMFPCGSVTGAPKARATALIAELEGERRGVYCGAVGLVRPAQSGVAARFNVAIRTAEVDTSSGRATFGSGGAVVASSLPADEYREMLLKADMLSAPTRAFRLVETFRHRPGAISENLPRHLSRLRASALYYGFPLRTDLEAWVAVRLDRLRYEARVRLLLSRGGRLDLYATPAPPPLGRPVRLAVDDEPVNSLSVSLFHKTTQRGQYERRRARHRLVDDVVMVNERGECTEVTTANLALLLGGTWFTPALSSGCLPGVERARLVELGTLGEATLTLSDLRSAEALAVVNSLRGWREAHLEESRELRD